MFLLTRGASSAFCDAGPSSDAGGGTRGPGVEGDAATRRVALAPASSADGVGVSELELSGGETGGETRCPGGGAAAFLISEMTWSRSAIARL